MRKILFIRKAPFSGTNGTIRYCETLFKMFCNDTELQPLAIENYPTIKSFLFHYYYKIPALAKAIKNADIVHVNGYTERQRSWYRWGHGHGLPAGGQGTA